MIWCRGIPIHLCYSGSIPITLYCNCHLPSLKAMLLSMSGPLRFPIAPQGMHALAADIVIV